MEGDFEIYVQIFQFQKAEVSLLNFKKRTQHFWLSYVLCLLEILQNIFLKQGVPMYFESLPYNTCWRLENLH